MAQRTVPGFARAVARINTGEYITLATGARSVSGSNKDFPMGGSVSVVKSLKNQRVTVRHSLGAGLVFNHHGNLQADGQAFGH